VSVVTQHNDVARTGANLAEATLSPTNVQPTQFGKVFDRTVDDQIYGQPLVLADVAMPKGTTNVLYVATMNDTVYAFDADSTSATAPLWQVSFLTQGVTPVNHDMVGQTGCSGMYSDISGNIGVESTPVIDPTTKTLYVVAKTLEGGAQVYRLHALDAVTGSERPSSPVVIQASVPGTGAGSQNGTLAFDASVQNQRAGLALINGTVYVGFGAYCDSDNYHGWLLGYDPATLKQTAVLNTTPHGLGGAIWSSGQAPAADASGNLYVIAGNGPIMPPSNVGIQAGGVDLSQTALKLSPDLALLDWFMPNDWQMQDTADSEMGSSGLLVVPQSQLVVTGSKSSTLYVLGTASLGKYQAGSDSQIAQKIAVGAGEIHGGPIAWALPGGTRVYAWAEQDALRAYAVSGQQLQPMAAGDVSGVPWPGGGNMSLSANGTTAGTGIVWANMAAAAGANNGMVVPGVLRAADATSLATLYDSSQNATRDSCGSYAKFSTPTIANGKVYLSSFSGQVCVYGLLP
jgi:hypothetical protein